MTLIDAHCHLEPKDYPDPKGLFERARAEGLVHAVVVGQLQGRGDFGAAIALAAAHPDFLTPTVGIHPHDAAEASPEDFALLEQLCARPEVAAVGETGLDYYYDRSPRDVQRKAFSRQCALAKKLGKPLVVHVRDAHEECARILADEGVSKGMIHCFTGDEEAAARYLALGFELSISGLITYKKTEAIQAAVKLTPVDRLMIETDCPYLAPVPYRGKKNEPAYVSQTARKVAELKGLQAEELALAAARNTARLLSLKVTLP